MKWNLFIGRYQPLHKGHTTLFETVLNEGGKVLIGLRDTPISENNPYSIEDRKLMFSDFIDKWGKDNVQLIVLPDIESVCYGRDVGYNIRKIDLLPEIESISATEIRRNNPFL